MAVRRGDPFRLPVLFVLQYSPFPFSQYSSFILFPYSFSVSSGGLRSPDLKGAGAPRRVQSMNIRSESWWKTTRYVQIVKSGVDDDCYAERSDLI